MKRLLINSGIVIGNIFLSHALFILPFVLKFLNDGFAFALTFCLVLIAVNIILYIKLLKRHFKPVENRKTALYFLMPLIGCALWMFSIFVIARLGFVLCFDFGYADILIFILPSLLITLIPLAVGYQLFFRKYVSEKYCTYLLSVMGIAVLPITIFTVIPVD